MGQTVHTHDYAGSNYIICDDHYAFRCICTLAKNYAAGVHKIKDTKYDSVSPQEVASQCSRLSIQEQHQLHKLIKQFPTLFSGQFDRYNESQFTLELLDQNTVPIFYKPYPITQTYMQVFSKGIQPYYS